MLSQDQIKEFHSSGFVTLPQVLAEDELSELQAVSAMALERALAGHGPPCEIQPAIDSPAYVRMERIWDSHEAFRSLTAHPTILKAVGQLLPHPFAPLDDSLVCKIPQSKWAIPWHQDPPYDSNWGARPTFRTPDFDVDVYLDDSDVESGCLWVVPGAHLDGWQPNIEGLMAQGNAVARPVLARAGDVGLRAISLPHASWGNDSGHPRRIVMLHFVTMDVHSACYGAWPRRRDLFARAGLERFRRMFDARLRQGRETLPLERIAWTDQGLLIRDPLDGEV